MDSKQEQKDLILYKQYYNGKVGCLTLNRPDNLNAVNDKLLNQLSQHLDYLSNSKHLSILIIKSSIKRAFCSGIDIKSIKTKNNAEVAHFFEKLANVLEKIIQLPQLTISSINGITYGAGADIALSCDYRIANTMMQMRFPGPQFGVILGTHRLVSEVGHSRAKNLILTNREVKSKQALDMGLIHEISKKNDSFEDTLDRANKMLSIPEYTLWELLKVCSNEKNSNPLSPPSLAKESILNGDFQKRFSRYLKQE